MSIVTIACSSLAGVLAVGVLGIACVCCAVRTWGRVRKLPILKECKQQALKHKERVLEIPNMREDEKQKAIERADEELDNVDKMICKVVADGTQDEEVNTNPSRHSVASASEHNQEILAEVVVEVKEGEQ